MLFLTDLFVKVALVMKRLLTAQTYFKIDYITYLIKSARCWIFSKPALYAITCNDMQL